MELSLGGHPFRMHGRQQLLRLPVERVRGVASAFGRKPRMKPMHSHTAVAVREHERVLVGGAASATTAAS